MSGEGNGHRGKFRPGSTRVNFTLDKAGPAITKETGIDAGIIPGRRNKVCAC